MSIHRMQPSAALRPFVRSIFAVSSSAGETRVVLPEPGFVLGFRVGGPGSSIDDVGAEVRSTSALTGLRTTLRRMLTPAAGVTVVATFRPLATARFFALPLHELFGRVAPLCDLVASTELREVEQRLADTTDTTTRLRLVDEFLVGRMRERDDALVACAVDRIVRADGRVRIGRLARDLGTSRDPLEKRFRRFVGASPKQFASIIRFRRAVAASASGRSLAEVAQLSGYFDQSHLVRDFRAVTGEPPSRFIGRVPFCDDQRDPSE